MIPLFESAADAEKRGFYGFTGLGREFGVSRQVAHMWYKRQSTNGFPPVAAQYMRDSMRRAPLFDIGAVRKWHAAYVPRLGGRPVASTK